MEINSKNRLKNVHLGHNPTFFLKNTLFFIKFVILLEEVNMSDEKTPQGGEKTENQTPQGGADKAKVASSGSTNDVAYNDALKLIETLKKENFDHRENKRVRDEQDKEKERKTAEEKGEYKKLYESEKSEKDGYIKKIADNDKKEDTKKKEIAKRYKEALGKLTADQKKQFEDMYADMTDDPAILLNKLYSFHPAVIDPASANSQPASQADSDSKIDAIIKSAKTDAQTMTELRQTDSIQEILKSDFGRVK